MTQAIQPPPGTMPINEPARILAAKADEMLDSIQYLRAIAAWLVVAYHLTASMARETGADWVFSIGAIGVDIFFILSGLLMAMIVARGEPMDLRFLARRLFRIAPLYYVMTLVLFVIALVAPAVLNTASADPVHLLTSLLFLPGGGAADDGNQPILSLGWTLNYEMAFYAAVYVAVRVFGDRTLLGLAAVLAALAVVGRLLPDPGMVVSFYTDPIIVEFSIGIVLYNVVMRERRAEPGEGVYWIALASGVMLLAVQFELRDEEWRFLIWGLPAALVVVGGVQTLTMRIGWLRKLGDWSYSTYLLHVYVIQAAAKLVVPAVGWSPVMAFFLYPVLALAIIAGSWWLHTRLEIPATRWLQGRFIPRRS